MTTTRSFGAWVRQRRAALDLTQRELADRIPCHTVTIRKIESGRSRPSKQLAERLADCLAIAPQERIAFMYSARTPYAAQHQEALPATAAELAQTPPRSPNPLPQDADFVGREQELTIIQSLLLRRDVRLLTLSGPGGIGKTTLARRIAALLQATFPHGISFVSLVSISSPDLVAAAIARSLGVKERGDQPLTALLKTALEDKQLLLILDNFEHVMGAAALVEELLRENPGLKILITSRVVLHIAGEHEFQVPPMALPNPQRLPPLYVLAETATIRLFTLRSQSVSPDFRLTAENAPTIAEICVQLEGIPLSIELAAARMQLLSTAGLLSRLTNRLDLLTSGPRTIPTRHQSLRSVIAWSVALLDDATQLLYARLGVFRSGCTLAAVEAICGAPAEPFGEVLNHVQTLIDSNLLWREQGVAEEPRVAMLETIREYALERLEATGRAEALRQRHMEYYLAYTEQAAAQLQGQEQELWLDRLERDHENIRTALQWALDHEAVEQAFRMVNRLGRFWRVHSHLSEGRRWLELALGQPGPIPAALRARALVEAGTIAWLQCDYSAARALHQESLRLQRELGDTPGTAMVLNNLGMIACDQGAYSEADTLLEESYRLYQACQDKAGIASVRNNLGLVAYKKGDYAGAQRILEDNLRLWQELGDEQKKAVLLLNLGDVMLCQDDYGQARTLYQQGLACFWYVGDKAGVAHCLEGIAKTLYMRRDLKAMVRLYAAIASLRSAIGAPLPLVDRQEYESILAHARQQLGEAGYRSAWSAGEGLAVEHVVAEVCDAQ